MKKLISEFHQILHARMWDLNNKIGHDVTKRCHQIREYPDYLETLCVLDSLLESPVRQRVHRQVKIPVRNALLYGK